MEPASLFARSKDELERVREEFAASGWPLVAESCDVGVRGDVGRMIASVQEQLGEIDILVNNAGTIPGRSCRKIRMSADFEDAMQTNFRGPFYTTQRSVATNEESPMRAHRQHRIDWRESSISFHTSCLTPRANSPWSVIAKDCGLIRAKYNVLVTTVCPGLMRTGSPRNAISPDDRKKNMHGSRSAILFRSLPSGRSAPHTQLWTRVFMVMPKCISV